MLVPAGRLNRLRRAAMLWVVGLSAGDLSSVSAFAQQDSGQRINKDGQAGDALRFSFAAYFDF
jgi:hypothetical protein